MRRVIVHVDMDCFFTACEVKRNPALKGKPVAVGATGDRGVLSTASYEARKFGLRSALPILTAKRLCPDCIFLPVDGEYYRRESKTVMEALASVSSKIQKVSVDEAYLDCTDIFHKYASLQKLGEYIQSLIFKKTQLTCSVGIAHSRRVAKIASEYKKPQGVTVVHDAKSFLAPLSIGDIPGIGKKSVLYYQKYGVNTIGDLAAMDRFRVLDLFGNVGVHMHNIALGKDNSTLSYRSGAKSASRERTFMQTVKDKDVVMQKVKELCQKVYEDVDGYSFSTISIKYRYSDFSTFTRDKKISITNVDSLYVEIKKLFDKFVDPTIGLRLIGVKLSGLHKEKAKQKSLFDFGSAAVSVPAA